jgi:hypothetical protein
MIGKIMGPIWTSQKANHGTYMDKSTFCDDSNPWRLALAPFDGD